MPIDPSAERFLRMMAAARSAGPIRENVAERRLAVRRLLTSPERPEIVGGIEDRVCPGTDGPIHIRIYTPPSMPAGLLSGMIYFHGGGLVAGSLDTHDKLCRTLANEIGCRVLAVEYRLAPEHRFPAGLTDSYAATAWAYANAVELGIDPDRVALGGDSVGGALAALVCQTARRVLGISIAYQLLLCPVLDFAGDTESRRAFADGYLLDKGVMEQDLRLYLPPGMGPADPRISPLRSTDLRDHPPTFIHTAEFDPVRDEGQHYAERLRLAGALVHHTCHPGMIHLFYGLGHFIPYARTAVKLIGAEIRTKSY